MAFPFTGAHSHAFSILLPSEQLSPSWSLNPFSSSRWRQTLVDPSPNRGKHRPFVRNPAQVFFRQRSSPSIRAQISKLPSTQKEGEGGGEATTLSSLPSSSTSVPSPSGGEPRARLKARMTESLVIEEAERPLAEYMSLPASQYSVLDAQRIERVDENTFRCYVYRVKFFNFEVCPVLLVRVDEQPNGCCIKLLSCTLEGSPLVVAQNKKFSASMINTVSWSVSELSPTARRLHSDATIEVVIEVPFAFRAIPIHIIEGTGTQVLSQLLKAMLPRFLAQLEKDYRAWASGDSSRQPLGTGEL